MCLSVAILKRVGTASRDGYVYNSTTLASLETAEGAWGSRHFFTLVLAISRALF